MCMGAQPKILLQAISVIFYKCISEKYNVKILGAQKQHLKLKKKKKSINQNH